MKTYFFCLIAIIATVSLISASNEGDEEEDTGFDKPRLPCPGCVFHHDPVCAISTKTGVHKTFTNSCEVSAADCGKTEHRKLKPL